MTPLSRLAFAAAWVIGFSPVAVGFAQSGDSSVVALIEPIRKTHTLPALGAALITSGGIVASGVTGVRKADADVPATIDDHWHLGSTTKAMTAVLIATLIEHGKLRWETTLGEAFPELAATFPADFGAITAAQLLSHRAGLVREVDRGDIARSASSVQEQRLNALRRAAATTLASPPGTTYAYSNLGYTLAGAITERVGGRPWESLIRDFVFTPLGMTSCGFGGLGTPGHIDQPWPHQQDGTPRPTNGPAVDNPAFLGPAGTVHCSIKDWSAFLVDQLRGRGGKRALLKPDTYTALHTPQFGGHYAYGWWLGIGPRELGGLLFLWHSGSNRMNY